MKFNLAKLAIKRPVTMCMIVLALVVFGISAIFTAPVEMMPEMEIPMMIVSTIYPGAGPEEVESLVTKKIESSISTIAGLKNIQSTSSENISMVMLELNYGTNIDVAHIDLQKQVDLVKADLPDEVKDPQVIEININSLQDTVSLSASSEGDLDLLYYIQEEVVPEFEKISGVASVSTSGGQKNYISVQVDQKALKQHRLDISSVVAAVSTADFSIPLGNADRADESVSLQGGVEYNSIESLKTIPIPLATGDIVHLSDIANVHEAAKEHESISRYNGEENVTIGIQKRQSASTLGVAEDVKKIAEQINNEQMGVSLEIINSADDEILSTIQTVITTLIIAVILAMLVIYLFIGDWKGSLIIGTSIPIALFTTLMFMNAFGFSFNLVSLSALIIAIGNMVDNSVVVLDNCFAVRKHTKTLTQAAIEGTQSVMMSQIAGSLASIVTILPLGLMKGMSGQMFMPMGLTIIFATISSVLSALTIVPLLFVLIKPQEKTDIPISRALNKLRGVYSRFLKKTFRHKKMVVLSSVALLVVSILLASTLNFELMTAADEGTISMAVELKPGLQLDLVDEAILPLEAMVSQHPDVERYSVTAGSGTSILSSGGGSATIMAYLKDNRKTKTDDLIDQWRSETQDWAGYDINIQSVSSMSMSTSGVEILLQGTDQDSLRDASDMVVEMMNNNPSLSNVSSTATAKNPRAEIKVNPVKANAVGLSPMQVLGSVYTILSSNETATLTQDGREYDIFVEFPRDQYRNIADFSNITLNSPRGGEIPLLDIAEISYTTSPQSIYRKNNQYQVTISGQPSQAVKLTAAGAIKDQIKEQGLPEGVSLGATSMDESMTSEFTSIIGALLTAVVLMFIVMAIQFESVRFSVVVMICIPFSIIGAFLFMWMTNVTFSMVSLLGFVLLFTTVINNGILFIDTTAELQTEGVPVEEALIEAGLSRIRPILMTSCVSIISMIPEGLGIGDGAEVMQSMAIVIIGGLVAATVLTLLLLPTFYLLFGGGSTKRQEKLERMRKIEEDDLEALGY